MIGRIRFAIFQKELLGVRSQAHKPVLPIVLSTLCNLMTASMRHMHVKYVYVNNLCKQWQSIHTLLFLLFLLHSPSDWSYPCMNKKKIYCSLSLFVVQ